MSKAIRLTAINLFTKHTDEHRREVQAARLGVPPQAQASDTAHFTPPPGR